MRVRRTGIFWTLGVLALVPAAAILPGCSGGGGGVTLPGQNVSQLANQVFVGNYAAVGEHPAGNFRLEFNGDASGGTFTIFDLMNGSISGPITITDNHDGTVTVHANLPANVQAQDKKTSATRSFDAASILAALINQSTKDVNVTNLQVDGVTHPATAAAVVDTPLNGRTFESDFSGSSASGHYKVVVGSKGDVTLTGTVNGSNGGSFAGTGTIGLPSATGKTDYALIATALVTSGNFKGQSVTFNGKVTALTPATSTTDGSITVSGDVRVFGAKVASFTTSTTIPKTGGGGTTTGDFNGARIPGTGTATFILSGNNHGGGGGFHLTVGTSGIPTITVDNVGPSGSDIKQGQVFTGAKVGSNGDFSLTGNTGFGSPVIMTGHLTKSGTTVTLTNFVIKIDGQNSGGLDGTTSVSGTIGGGTSPAYPISFTAGSYNGSVKNTSEQGQPTVGTFQVLLNCQGTGTVHFKVTAPGATFQNSSNDTSKELDGTVTSYDANTGTIGLRLTAYDTETHGTVTISGSVKVTKNGGTSVTAAGNLTDSEEEGFSVNLNTFTPNQQGCG